MVRDLVRERAGREAVARFAVPLGGALLAWAAVNLPVYLAVLSGALFVQPRRGADWGSVYYVLGMLELFPSGDREMVNLVGTTALLVCCVGIAALTWFAPRRPR